MKTTTELLDEQYRLWGQIQGIGHAIRYLQCVDNDLRQQAGAVDAELKRRCESMRDLLREQNGGEIS